MMDRRTFLRRTAILAVAIAVIPSMLGAQDAPRSLFDPRDDAPLLQGMLDRGEPIAGGVYVLRSTVCLRAGSVVHGNVFHYDIADHIAFSSAPGVGHWRMANNTFFNDNARLCESEKGYVEIPAGAHTWRMGPVTGWRLP